jgi:hypothetical protein
MNILVSEKSQYTNLILTKNKIARLFESFDEVIANQIFAE